MIPIKEVEHQADNWEFNFQDSGLSASAEIQKIGEECKLFRSPSIIFGKNLFQIRHKSKPFTLLFNAQEALKFINYQHREQNFYPQNEQPKLNGISYIPEKLQIKHAEVWKNLDRPKDIQITEIEESSDSFYVTPFKGHVGGDAHIERVEESVIPLDKLGPQNEIKFYHQGSLYEDELDDNGLIQYEYKFRCMQENWFGLIRCYVRVDDVIIMILDTRIYWEKGWEKIGRQFMVRKSKWSEIKEKGFEFSGAWSTNPHQSHQIYEYLSEDFTQNQFIYLH